MNASYLYIQFSFYLYSKLWQFSFSSGSTCYLTWQTKLSLAMAPHLWWTSLHCSYLFTASLSQIKTKRTKKRYLFWRNLLQRFTSPEGSSGWNLSEQAVHWGLLPEPDFLSHLAPTEECGLQHSVTNKGRNFQLINMNKPLGINQTISTSPVRMTGKIHRYNTLMPSQNLLRSQRNWINT